MLPDRFFTITPDLKPQPPGSFYARDNLRRTAGTIAKNPRPFAPGLPLNPSRGRSVGVAKNDSKQSIQDHSNPFRSMKHD
jgi:hypothetical protein